MTPAPASPAMIPLHPQTVPDRPDQLRWIVPAATLTCTGAPTAVPRPLAALLDDGTLAEIMVEPAAVVTGLGAGRTWRGDGPRVRTALHTALADPDGWHAGSGEPGGDAGLHDALLHDAAQDVITELVGPHARSHGGSIDLLGVSDGVVTVRLGGACHGCPAAWFTLHQRLERLLRRRCPYLVEVRHTGPGGTKEG
ncbi:NifU family protein [Streptomyces sp. NPDC047000]|uniref:NifU family protein n=1 Tax=Streptomyces sp. NPDC047000 TaxID=3155474 RepID=UPI0033DDA474